MYKYLIPNYYGSFRCKCGDCRHPCCIGWKISVGQDEYFRLLGLDCSEALRKNLDRAFTRCEAPSPESYAEITPNWYGRCPLMDENGLCSLQVECGEGVIPQICRYYPRSARSDSTGCELFCAGSCEKTAELLTENDEPFGFGYAELETVPEECDTEEDARECERNKLILMSCVKILSDRGFSLTDRLMNMRVYLEKLTENDLSPADELEDTAFVSRETEVSETERRDAFESQVRLFDWFSENSASIADYADEAYALLGLEEISDCELNAAYEKYRMLAEDFEKKYPRCEIMLEKLLINHLCFCEFPVRTKGRNISHTSIALCAVYTMLRFMLVTCTSQIQSETQLSETKLSQTQLYERFIDIVSAAFRLMDHTRFDTNSLIILNRLDCVSSEKLRALILL